MSAPFVIPFNFAPTSVVVRTSSYTIPTGKYAQVYVECDSGGIFTIDGNSAVVTAAFVNVSVIPASGASASYTVPTGYKASLKPISTNTSDIAYVGTVNHGVQAVNTVSNGGSVELGAGGISGVFAQIVGTRGVFGIATPSLATERQATFWVKSGTVISGSGNWKAVVQEYNTIT